MTQFYFFVSDSTRPLGLCESCARENVPFWAIRPVIPRIIFSRLTVIYLAIITNTIEERFHPRLDNIVLFYPLHRPPDPPFVATIIDQSKPMFSQ